jgi:nitrous oxidase accessory protein
MKRKCLTVGIILLFVGTCIIPAIAQDTEKTQPTSRSNWLYVGGSGPGNYTKIQDAIDNASDGDTVFVYDDSSPYLESVKINKSISLKGENPETTVISGNESFDTIDFQMDNINLTGFTIKNGHYAITNSVVNISNCTVFNNIIDDNDRGIRFGDCFNLTITNNNFFENYFALVIKKSHQIIVSLNTIKFNFEGIEMEGNENVTISLNTIELNSDIGICLYQYPSTIFIPNNYQVFKNTIKNNYEAIYNDQESGIFRDNVIESNHVGINFQYSSKTVISKNLIKNNSVGVTIHDGSHNEIIMNNFLQNERGAAFFYHLKIGFRRPQNVFRQNYWDTNTSLGPKSIKGQLEFNVGFYHTILIRIPWFCFDWFPAKEPYDIPGMR